MRHFWPDIPRRTKHFLEPMHVKFDREFRASLTPTEPFEFVPMLDLFCNDDGCLTYIGDDVYKGLVVFDDQHLRPAASKYAAEQALTPLIMRLIASAEANAAPPE
jgi:hypothetical protein